MKNATLLVASREIITRARTKAFIITTVLLLIGSIALAVLSRYASGDDTIQEVTVGVRAEGMEFSDALAAGSERLSVEVEEVDASDESLVSGDVDVIFDGENLIWESTPSTSLEIYIYSTVQQQKILLEAKDLNLSQAEVEKLLTPVELEEVFLEGDTDERNLRMGIAAIVPIAMFFLLQISGQFIMMGVVEEKSSRVVEVILGRLRPRTLLAGKVLGLGTLVFSQAALIASGLLLTLALTSGVQVSGELWALIPLFLPVFVLGYIFYATAFAAAASLVTRQEDLQSVVWPIMFPLLAGYILAVSSVGEPDTIAITIASYVPFTSPVVLPFRLASGIMPWWEVSLSLALLAISATLMLHAASRIYEGALLRNGKRIGWMDAWRNRADL